MESHYFLKTIGALILVGCLIYLALILLKKVHPYYYNSNKITNPRLKIEEQLFLSPKQRIVIVNFDDTQKYILLLGHTEVVIDKVKIPIKSKCD